MNKELIKTDNYLLVVDDSEIKVGDVITDKYNVWTWKDDSSLLGRKKVIAHLPLNNSPIIEGVPLLPPLEQEDDAICPYPESKQNAVDWHNGYNKAKEKYKYTEEDLKLAMNYGYVQGDTGFQGVANLDDLLDLIHRKIKKSSRPTHFECEVMCGRCRSIDDECWSAKECSRGYDYPDIMRTTTNSQGQQVVCGKYIY